MSGDVSTREDLRNAVRLLRDAGQRGSDGYPPSVDRVSEHERAARAVEELALALSSDNGYKHHPLCASNPGSDPGPEGEGYLDERGRFVGKCDCKEPAITYEGLKALHDEMLRQPNDEATDG